MGFWWKVEEWTMARSIELKTRDQTAPRVSTAPTGT
jgi:hypothetical protein